MKLKTVWAEKMRFNAAADQHSIPMDAKAPFGLDTAPTPKQLVLAAISGCAGMDVVGLLKKNRQAFESLEIDAEATMIEGAQPAVFQQVHLLFSIRGNVEPAKAIEAVTLSQTKFCSVSAMLSKAVPISYIIKLNSEVIGSGTANFSSKEKP